MNNILILSQDGKMQIYPELITIGRRQPIMVIGDKLKELMDKHNMTIDDLIKKIGNSYRNNITRIVNSQEIPNSKMLEKLINVFEVDEDYFIDKELENVVCVQDGIIVGKYDTNARADEVRIEVQDVQKRAHLNNKQVFYEMPQK